MIASLATLLSRFFRWWFSELAACVPARWRELVQASRSALLLIPAGDVLRLRLKRGDSVQDLGHIAAVPESMRSAAAQALHGIPVERTDIVVLVSDSQVLHRRLTLPLAAAENLQEILGFELERHTPFPAGQAAFDYRVVSTDRQSQEISVDLIVATRALADRAKEEALALGLAVTRVDVANPDGTPQGWNLLQHEPEALDTRTLRRLDVVLGAAVCVLLVLALWLPLERKQRELAVYQAQLTEMETAAAEVETLRGEIGTILDRRQFLGRHRDATPRAIAVLAEVTKRLPDDSWATQLRLDRRDLLLSGFAPAAADLITVFEESALFSHVRFAAPVTPDPQTNLERFNLTLPLAAATGGQ